MMHRDSLPIWQGWEAGQSCANMINWQAQNSKMVKSTGTLPAGRHAPSCLLATLAVTRASRVEYSQLLWSETLHALIAAGWPWALENQAESCSQVHSPNPLQVWSGARHLARYGAGAGWAGGLAWVSQATGPHWPNRAYPTLVQQHQRGDVCRGGCCQSGLGESCRLAA